MKLFPARWIVVFSRAALFTLLLAGCRDNPSTSDSADHLERDRVTVYDLENKPVDPLQDREAKAVVFVFVATDCPVSNRYAPEIRRLHGDFVSKGMAFRLVYPGRDTAVESIKLHLKEYELPMPALRDVRHALVKRAGVKVTPEAAVFLRDRKLIYRGRIDNRYVSLGRERLQATRHDLQEVLEAIAAQKPLAFSTTPAVGCYIPESP